MWTVELTTQPGTQDFMPPKALEDPPRYGLSVDVFSFGCVIIHLATHKWPKPSGKLAYHYDTKILSEWDRRRKFISEMRYDILQPIVEQCLKDRDYHRPSSKEVLSMLEDISRTKHWTKPFGTNQPCGDTNLGSLVIKDYYTGDTRGNSNPLTMNNIHHNYAGGKLYVLDRVIECIQQLEIQVDQQQERYLEHMHSMPVIPRGKVQFGGQPRVINLNRDDDKQKPDYRKHQREAQKRKSDWNTQAVYNGHPGKEDDQFLDTL